MLKTDVVRAQPAVQAFDFREILKEYGFTVGTKADVEAARTLITGMVTDADTVMTRLVTDCEELGQNPYKRTVSVNGENVDFAMEIPLFPSGELTARIDKVFTNNPERKGRPVPDQNVLAAKIKDGIAAVAREANYELCAIELHADGAPLRIILRDPTYAAEAAKHSVEDKGPDISDVARLLSAERVKQLDSSAEAMGITGAATAEQVQSLRATIKSLVDGAASAITQRLQALDDNAVSPFATTPFRFSKADIHYLDNKLVSWGWGRSIEKPVVIEVFDYYKVHAALQQGVPSYSNFVDEDRFADHVRKALVDALRAVPNLPIAAITSDKSAYRQTKVVLVSPDVWARARGVAQLPAPERPAALPPPEAIAPVSLPIKL